MLKALGLGALASVAGTGTAAADRPGGDTAFEFERLVGNTLTGADGAIRGVNAGGLPWVVDEAEARLETDGTLKVEVEGLVIAPDADHPAAGTNPVPAFRAAVSCLTLDGGAHVAETLQTGTAPASGNGDAEIEATLDLPDPCLAPIVFVTHPNGAWFAVSGA